jgi:hypothetical protein
MNRIMDEGKMKNAFFSESKPTLWLYDVRGIEGEFMRHALS